MRRSPVKAPQTRVAKPTQAPCADIVPFLPKNIGATYATSAREEIRDQCRCALPQQRRISRTLSTQMLAIITAHEICARSMRASSKKWREVGARMSE
jgi:hypothetical protein